MRGAPRGCWHGSRQSVDRPPRETCRPAASPAFAPEEGQRAIARISACYPATVAGRGWRFAPRRAMAATFGASLAIHCLLAHRGSWTAASRK